MVGCSIKFNVSGEYLLAVPAKSEKEAISDAYREIRRRDFGPLRKPEIEMVGFSWNAIYGEYVFKYFIGGTALVEGYGETESEALENAKANVSDINFNLGNSKVEVTESDYSYF